VKEVHLKKVVSMSRDFKEYMKATHENLDGNYPNLSVTVNITDMEKIPKWHIGAGCVMIQRSIANK